jgi:hypothetical protein
MSKKSIQNVDVQCELPKECCDKPKKRCKSPKDRGDLVCKYILESSGIVTIEESEITIVYAGISRINCTHYMKDVTKIIREHVNEYYECSRVSSVNTGLMNEFTCCDVAFGFQKQMYIEYYVNGKTRKEKKRHRCEPKHHQCEPKHHQCEPKHHQCEPKHHQCEPKHHHCEPKHHHHRVHMNKMLLFPLFPIRGAYIYPLHSDHHKC